MLGSLIPGNQQLIIKINKDLKALLGGLNMIEIVYSRYKLKYQYFLTRDGKVYSKATKKFLTTHLDKDGYEKVRLVCNDNKRHTFSVHRLMMENFNPRENMNELQVNHIDGNKLNNKIENLEWCTCLENIRHAAQHGLRAKQYGEHNPMSKVTETQVKEVIQLLLTKKYSGAEIDRMYGFCKDFSNSIKRKEAWTYLTKDIDFN